MPKGILRRKMREDFLSPGRGLSETARKRGLMPARRWGATLMRAGRRDRAGMGKIMRMD